jgi:hypothetical protein
MKEKVAAAMADKYWMDILIRHESHPMVARLVPKASPPQTSPHQLRRQIPEPRFSWSGIAPTIAAVAARPRPARNFADSGDIAAVGHAEQHLRSASRGNAERAFARG